MIVSCSRQSRVDCAAGLVLKVLLWNEAQSAYSVLTNPARRANKCLFWDKFDIV